MNVDLKKAFLTSNSYANKKKKKDDDDNNDDGKHLRRKLLHSNLQIVLRKTFYNILQKCHSDAD